MSINDNAFEAITRDTFNIELPERTGISLVCRSIPFNTLMAVCSMLAKTTSNTVASSRKTWIQNLLNVPDEELEEAVKRNFTVDAILPMLTDLVKEMPEAADRILLDVIVDATPEQMKYLSIGDVLAIIAAVIETIDTETWASRLR